MIESGENKVLKEFYSSKPLFNAGFTIYNVSAVTMY